MKNYYAIGLILFAVLFAMNIGIASAALVTVPSKIIAYVPVYINPSEQINGNFQQMVYFNPSTYPYINTNNMQNIEFFYSNGIIIPSWLESFGSTNAVYWLNLGSESQSGTTVYMGFANTGTNLFSMSTGVGEAPNLSSTYGEYDTGSQVFYYYQAFGGISKMPSVWSNTISEDPSAGNTVITFNPDNTTISAGTVPSGVGGGEGIYSTSIPVISSIYPPGGSIIEWYGNMYNSEPAGSIAGLLSQGTTTYDCPTPSTLPEPLYEFNCHAELYTFNTGSSNSLSTTATLSLNSGDTNYNTTTDIKNINQVYSIAIPSGGTSFTGMLNYTTIGTVTGITPPAYGAQLTLAFSPGHNPATNANSDPQSIYWLRTRVYPPNGDMPSVSFGSYINTVPQDGATVTVSNETYSVGTGNVPNAVPGQVETITASITGGTEPYQYEYRIYNTSSGLSGNCGFATLTYPSVQTTTNSTSFTSNNIPNPPTSECVQNTGSDSYTANVTITDSASMPESIYGTAVFYAYNGENVESPYASPSNYTCNGTPNCYSGHSLLYYEPRATVSGSSVSYKFVLVGQGSGISGKVTENLVDSSTGAVVATNNIVGSSSGTTVLFPTFTAPGGTDSYYVSVTDSGFTTPYTYNSPANTIVVTPVTVNGALSVSASDSSASVTIGSSETLTATITGGTPSYKYQWYTISGTTNTPISGATSSTYTPSTSSAGTFVYGVNVIDATNIIAYSNPVSFSVTTPSTPTSAGPGVFTGGRPPVTTTTIKPTTTVPPTTTSSKTTPTPPPTTTTVKTAPATTTVLPTTPTSTAGTLPPPSRVKPPSSSNTSLYLIIAVILIILILLALYLYTRRKKQTVK